MILNSKDVFMICVKIEKNLKKSHLKNQYHKTNLKNIMKHHDLHGSENCLP